MLRILAATSLALSLFTVTFAVNLQAPLYSAYVAGSGHGATAVTIAFSAYVAGLMPTLCLLGGLSDRIGRKPPLALALVLGAVATALLVLLPTWTSLIAARFLLGVGTALATTAGAAYMTEILRAQRTRSAALAVTSATSLGFGGGALATGLSLTVQGPTFFPVSFAALFVAAPILALLTLALPRLDAPKPVSLLRLPVFPDGTWAFGFALALAWSSTGMIIAVVPLQLAAHGLDEWTGPVIFLAIFIGFLCQPIAKRMSDEMALVTGIVLIPLGFAILLLGAWARSIELVLLGTGLSSASSYGFTYLAGLSQVAIRAPENRARATAGLFVYAYVGFSLPVIASGILADTFGLIEAMATFLFVLFLGSAVVLAVHYSRSAARYPWST